jgi:hypothetical protein
MKYYVIVVIDANSLFDYMIYAIIIKGLHQMRLEITPAEV